jgi:hypothetical protein
VWRRNSPAETLLVRAYGCGGERGPTSGFPGGMTNRVFHCADTEQMMGAFCVTSPTLKGDGSTVCALPGAIGTPAGTVAASGDTVFGDDPGGALAGRTVKASVASGGTVAAQTLVTARLIIKPGTSI